VKEKILIVDFGSQYSQLIARRIREMEVYCEIVPVIDIEKIKSGKEKVRGIIFSGGPASVYEKDSPTVDKAVFNLGIPILGICYGMQLITHLNGGKVEKAESREFGKAILEVIDGQNPLLSDIPKTSSIWMSHNDHITVLPDGFEIIAETDSSIAAITNNNGIYAKLQLRYPGDLMNFRNNSSLPRGAASLGMHNDCFMASKDDVGTYYPSGSGRSSEELRSFARENSIHQVFGGETCKPLAGARTSCADILREGAEYHVSYLNYDYHKTFIGNWESGSCMTEVRKRMGYRYVVEELSAYVDQQNSNIVHWSAKIANRGWANAPDWGYKLYLVVNGQKVLLNNRFSVQPGTAQSFRGSFLKSQLNGKAPILLIDTEDANYSGPHPLQFANADDGNAQKAPEGPFRTGLALKWLLSI